MHNVECMWKLMHAKYTLSMIKHKYNDNWLFKKDLFWKLIFHLKRTDNI